MNWDNVLQILGVMGKGIGYIFLYMGFMGALACHVVSLPGNWIIFILMVIYALITKFAILGWWTLGGCLILAVIGEVIEFYSGMWGAGKFGASRGAKWAALLGGIVGAVIGGGFFLIGAVIGAFAGTFAGAFIVEYIREQKSGDDSFKVGFGAMVGRIAGMVSKIIIGLMMIGWATFSIIKG